MSHAALYVQTAKRKALKTAQGETLGRGEGLDKGAEALFQELFNEAQEAIRRAYIPGTWGHIKAENGGLYEAILNREAEVERLWLAMRKGGNTLDKFKDALRRWGELHREAAGLYKGGEMDQGKLF